MVSKRDYTPGWAVIVLLMAGAYVTGYWGD